MSLEAGLYRHKAPVFIIFLVVIISDAMRSVKIRRKIREHKNNNQKKASIMERTPSGGSDITSDSEIDDHAISDNDSSDDNDPNPNAIDKFSGEPDTTLGQLAGLCGWFAKQAEIFECIDPSKSMKKTAINTLIRPLLQGARSVVGIEIIDHAVCLLVDYLCTGDADIIWSAGPPYIWPLLTAIDALDLHELKPEFYKILHKTSSTIPLQKNDAEYYHAIVKMNLSGLKKVNADNNDVGALCAKC